MLGERRFAWVAAVLLLGAGAGSWGRAHAQDAEAETPPETTEAAEAEGEADGEAAEEPASQPVQQPPQRPQTLDPPPPAPIMVVVLPQRRVPEETATAVGAALASALDEPAGRREVHALANPEILQRVAACEEDTCYGGLLAEAQAAAGVFVTISRRGRSYAISAELRDPVSGASRGEAVEGEIARDADPTEALAPLLEGITAQLPDPPPPDPTILVTVNVDEAEVSIDGISIGRSPVAPVTVAAGFHEVAVIRAGYASVRRRTQVAPGDTGRVDVTLNPLSPEDAAQTTQGAGGSQGQSSEVFDTPITEEWWFWTLIAGGAVLVIGAAIVIGMVAAQGGGSSSELPTGIPLPRIEGGI